MYDKEDFQLSLCFKLLHVSLFGKYRIAFICGFLTVSLRPLILLLFSFGGFGLITLGFLIDFDNIPVFRALLYIFKFSLFSL